MAIDRVFLQPGPEEEQFLSSLRPRTLDACVGQHQVREQLRIAVEAARQRNEPVDHILLDGPPGLGKTTLANIVANELGRTIRITSGPAITRQGDLMSLLTQMEAGDVLFIDEIHRLNKVVEEFLYPALEDFRVDYTTDSGIGGRTINFRLKPFTLIGATTRAGLLSAALRSRFGLLLHLNFYERAELTEILRRNSQILDVACNAASLERLADRARGTPRIANRLLRRVRDYSLVRAGGKVTPEVVDATMQMMQVDKLGLDALDHGYLKTLIEHYDGGPAGIEAIAASLGHERDTLEDVVEPFLLQIGLVIRTPRGRVARPAAYQHLGREAPKRRPEFETGGLFEGSGNEDERVQDPN